MKSKLFLSILFFFLFFSANHSSAEQMKLTGKIDVAYKYQMYFYYLYNEGAEDTVFLGAAFEIEDESFKECVETAGYDELHAEITGDFSIVEGMLTMNLKQPFTCKVLDGTQAQYTITEGNGNLIITSKTDTSFNIQVNTFADDGRWVCEFIAPCRIVDNIFVCEADDGIVAGEFGYDDSVNLTLANDNFLCGMRGSLRGTYK